MSGREEEGMRASIAHMMRLCTRIFLKRRKKTEKEKHIEGEKRRPKTCMHAHSTSPIFRRDLPIIAIIFIFVLSFSDISEVVENKNNRFRSSNRKTLAKNGMIRKQKCSHTIIHRSHRYLNFPFLSISMQSSFFTPINSWVCAEEPRYCENENQIEFKQEKLRAHESLFWLFRTRPISEKRITCKK